MPIRVTPVVPSTITVHLGLPDEEAENITVSFPDYVKNVASSEIYPTWEPAAIEANILAIVSFALNRVYTEFYPSRGYDFDITSTTAYDQKFIRGRNIFENISRAVDETFNDYIRRTDFVEPLAAKFCNGTTSTCDGLSQWGSQDLAQQGYGPMEILRYYYGEDIELVQDAPIRDLGRSYPGTPLRLGSQGENVVVVKTMLNRISQSYPAIPKIWPVTRVTDGGGGPNLPAHLRPGGGRCGGQGDLVQDGLPLCGDHTAGRAGQRGAAVPDLLLPVPGSAAPGRPGRGRGGAAIYAGLGCGV
jgi:hypothetical protein